MSKIEIFFDDINCFTVKIGEFSLHICIGYSNNREIEFGYENNTYDDPKQMKWIDQLISMGKTAPEINIQLISFSNYNIKLIKQFLNELNVNILKISGRTILDLFSVLNYIYLCRVSTLELSIYTNSTYDNCFMCCINDICIRLLENDTVKRIKFKNWNFMSYPKHISCVIESGDFIIQKIYDAE